MAFAKLFITLNERCYASITKDKCLTSVFSAIHL